MGRVELNVTVQPLECCDRWRLPGGNLPVPSRGNQDRLVRRNGCFQAMLAGATCQVLVKAVAVEWAAIPWAVADLAYCTRVKVRQIPQCSLGFVPPPLAATVIRLVLPTPTNCPANIRADTLHFQ